MAADTLTRRRPLNLLLVEDDQVDAQVVFRAFRDRSEIASVVHVRNGIEALARLRGADGYEPLPHPYLILLDLRMPLMDGHAFLSELRKDPQLRRCVVFVLTTSVDRTDIRQAYDQSVAGYLSKDAVGRDFDVVTRLVETYWQAVELPEEQS